MVIHVPKAARELKPIYINHDMFTGTYRRNWEGDYVCSKSEILGMLRDQPENTMDMKVLDHMEVDELNMETLRAYRNRHMALKPHHPWEKLSAHDYLEMIGAASKSKTDHKLHPTAAGLFMFGEEYQIVREYPEYFLDYREVLDPAIRWTDRFHSSSGEWTGNIFEFYFRVYNKLSKDIKVPFKIEDGTRIDDTPVHKAIREALANCLINCDYFGTCGIVIKKETDRIIMENPGVIRPGKHQMLRGGLSDPRNKALMKMFNMINIGERAGSGVPDIYYVWHNEGWEAPVIEERYHPDRTILTLPITKTIYVETVNKKPAIKTGDKKPAIKTGDKKPAIKTGDKIPAIKTGDKKINAKTKEHINLLLNCMEENKIYDLVTICDLINLKPSRTKEIVKLMINMEMIQPIGNSNKNRRYRKIV